MAGELLGRLSECPCEVALYRTKTGFRFRHTCSGNFDISGDGSEIVWYPAPTHEPEVIRNDVIGRVMSVVLHACGKFCLHGSAVALSGSAVAIVAPKGYGKSTLASALVRRGAQLITDDTVAVEQTSSTVVLPGIHLLRLRTDSAKTFRKPAGGDRRARDGKYVISDFESDQLVTRASPLAAVYVLSPIEADSVDTPVRRTRLSTVRGALSLVQHAKVGELIGKSEAAVVFDLATRIARTVPVFLLSVTRRLDAIDGVSAQLADWHSQASPCQPSNS